MKKILTSAILFLLIFPAFSVLVSAKYYYIQIDGDFSDWSDVPLLVSDPRDAELERYDISECYMANTGTYLFIRIDRYASGGETYALAMRTYLDTDQNPSTGYSIHGMGADYRLVFSYGDPGHNQLWKRSGSSWNFVTDVPFKFGSAGSRYGYETRLARSWIGNPTGVDAIFWVHNSGDYAPDSGYVSFYPWPTAHIEDIQTDKGSYNFGDQIELRVDVDTSKPSQDIKWLAELLDPNGVQQDYIYWQEYTVYDAEEDYWIPDEYLDIPPTGVEGSWQIRIRLRDQTGTDPDEDDRSIYRDVGEPPVPDFSIEVNPHSGEIPVPPGGSKTATVTITQIEGYSHTVDLSASGQPSGVTVTFNPNHGTPTFTSTMTIQVESTAPEGTYPITITGTGSDSPPTIHWTTYTLTVTEAPPPPRTISLKSRTTDGLENIGTITFAGTTYDLPDSLQKVDGSYTVSASPPGSYSFHHWEYSGGVFVSDKYANPTQASVSDDGELAAVFFLDIRLYFSQGEEYFPMKGLDFDHDGYINFNAWTVRNFPEWNKITDIDGDGNLDAPAYVCPSYSEGYRVVQYWIYYAFDNKYLWKDAPIPFIDDAPMHHEHDFEFIYLWMERDEDNQYSIIKRVSTNQHLWANNYENSLTFYYGTPPKAIHVAVEKAGHAMQLVTPLSKSLIKPDNSDTIPDTPVFKFRWTPDFTKVATLYSWKLYDGVNPTEDGFGDSNLLTTGANYAIWNPFAFVDGLGTLTWLYFDIAKSLDAPILLKSNEPYSTPIIRRLLIEERISFFIEAPWVRKEFKDPAIQWKKAGFSRTISEAAIKLCMRIMLSAVKDILKEMFSGIVDYITQFIFDPVNASVIDIKGQTIGYKDGNYVNDLPGGVVLWIDEELFVCLIMGETEKENYACIVQESQGIYSLFLTASYLDETPSHFNATEIPVTDVSTHEYTVGWELLKAGLNGTTVEIDGDGDGTFEHSLETGTTFSADQIGVGYAYTGKAQYIEGETVIVGFQNTGSTTITLPTTAPWVILDDSMSIVYRAIGAMIPVDVGPGEKKEWQWNQKDDYGQQVPLGTYFFQIETSAGTFTATFSIAGLPDLTITDVWWTPTEPMDGDTITVYVTEANIGDADAGPHTNRVMLDTHVLSDFSAPGLPAGTSRTFHFTITPTVVDNPYHVTVIVDVSDDVKEKDETNNLWEGDIHQWVRYVPTPDQTEIQVSTIAGITYAKVILTFPDTGYRVTDWGTLSADAKVWRWTGVSPLVITQLSHTYELGHLTPGTYEFPFRAWGNLVESQQFIVEVVHEVQIEINPPSLASVQPGSNFDYTISVVNKGNIQDTYDLTTQGLPTTWYSFSQDVITVDPAQTETVTLTVSPGADSVLQDYPFTVTATCQADPMVLDSGHAIVTVTYNLIQSPGFEAEFAWWSVSEGTATYITYSREPRYGSYCARGEELNEGSLGRLYQDVTALVAPGKHYKIGGWIKTEGVVGYVVIALDYVASNGWTPADGYVKEIGYVTGTTDWTYFESEIFTLPPMPDDCVAAWFLFDFNNGKGTAWWDDVQLIEVTEPSSYNILFDEARAGADTIDYEYYEIARLLRQLGHTADNTKDPLTSPLLSSYDILVITCPHGTYTTSELEAIGSFVQDGGGLLLMGQWSISPETGINQVAELFGVSFMGTGAVRDPDMGVDEFMPIITQFDESHPVCSAVSSIRIYGGRVLSIGGNTPLAWGDANTYGDLNDNGQYDVGEPIGSDAVVMAAAQLGSGRAVFISDTDLFDNDFLQDHDNQRLFFNIMHWLVELYPLPAGAKHWVPSDPRLDDTKLLINIDIAGQGQTASVSPEETISGSCMYHIWAPHNPNEINQGFFIMSWTPSWPAPEGYYIPIWNGISGLYPGTGEVTEPFSFTAPSTPGTYYLYWCRQAHYTMRQAVDTYDQPLTLPAHAKIIVEPPEPILRITAHSPVNILVTDPSGARVGYDPATGEVVNEIPGAMYSGPGTEPQIITIPSPLPGVYIIDRYGIGTGPYTIAIESVASDGTVIHSETWTGTASPGELERGSIQMFEDGTFVDMPHGVIPEVPLGTVMVSAAMIIALVAYIAVPKWRRKRKSVNQ